MAEKNNIDELSKNISNDFGIEQEKAEKLTKEIKTINSLRELKDELNELKIDNLKEEKIKELLGTILEARKKIEKNKILSETSRLKKSIDDTFKLKNSLEKDTLEYIKPSFSSKLFSTDFINKGQNPNSFGDQLKGGLLGSINSVVDVFIFSKNIVSGVLTSPYDGYNILTRKGEYDKFKRI